MSLGVTTKGFAELDKRLATLPNATVGVLLRRALLKGGNVIRDEARRLAPYLTGELRKRIVTRISKVVSESGMTVDIGPTAKAFYARFLELGSAAHTIRARRKRRLADKAAGHVFGKTVQHPGTAQQPFLRPALDTKGQEAVDVLGQELWREIQKLGAA